MRRYFIFGVIALTLALSQAGNSSVAVAFPLMVADFDASIVLTGWVLSIYQLVSIMAIPVAGKLSDTFGRKSTFLVCLALFTVGSFLSAIAPNLWLLLLFRVIQAAGGGGFIPCGVGIISDNFPEQRQRYVGLVTSILTFGSAIGPSVGGWLVQSYNWRSIFWINIPISLLSLALGAVLVRKDPPRKNSNSLDFISAALLMASVSAVMISLTLLGKDYHRPWPIIALMAAAGVAMAVILVHRSKHQPGAVITYEMLTRKPFLGANVYNFAHGAAVFGVMNLMPLYIAMVYGLGVAQAGLAVSTRAIGMMLASAVTSFYLVKWGYRKPLVTGVLIGVIGFLILALEPPGITLLGFNISSLLIVIIFAFIVGVGAGTASPAANNACIELMPDQVASITGVRQMFRQIGGALSITVGTLIIEFSPNPAYGFIVVFLGLSLTLLLTIPAIFLMPSSPNDVKSVSPSITARTG